MNMYSGKVVLITGASRGVGRDIADHFLSQNAQVIGLSRSDAAFEHKNYHHFSVDIGDAAAVTLCFNKEIRKAFKSIDFLINNAAVMTSQYSMIMPIKNASDMVQVNLLGLFMVSREASKLMRSKSAGRIVNIGSMASSLEPIGDALYAATKMGIITLANVMAKELAPLNITCNTVSISAIETDMLNSHSDTAKIKIGEIIENLPIPRMATKEDIINVIDFYCSDKSSYITAQTLYLGGIN